MKVNTCKTHKHEISNCVCGSCVAQQQCLEERRPPSIVKLICSTLVDSKPCVQGVLFSLAHQSLP